MFFDGACSGEKFSENTPLIPRRGESHKWSKNIWGLEPNEKEGNFLNQIVCKKISKLLAAMIKIRLKIDFENFMKRCLGH